MKQELSQQGLQSFSSGLPFRRLNFVLAQRSDSHSVAPSVDLHPLNPEMPSIVASKDAGQANTHRLLADKGFFSESDVQLTWGGPRKAGTGLVNLGNTCFMNSVLQCLTHTAPLAQLCLRDVDVSSSSDSQQQLDPIAATQAHIKRALSATQSALPPKWHARNLKAINRRFRLGRQEDAHEYLRCVLDAMHESFLRNIKPKPPPELAATTFVQRIFGGKLRSQIICEGVDYTSSTIDPFLDLSLEINKANNLAKALQHFTAAEVLDGDNRYRCPKNNKLVRAHKRISIDEAPNVLTIHLKRFDFFGRGHKLSRKVEFGLELDLAPYMTHRHHKHHHQHKHQPGQQRIPQHHLHGHHKPVMYDLYAVLVHLGHSLHSGHYVCYVKAGNGTWHLCDDHRVVPVSQRVVEGQSAYILFYIKRQPAAAALPPAVAAAAQQAAVAASRHAASLPQRQQQQRANSDNSTRTPVPAAAAAVFGQGEVLQVGQQPVQQRQIAAAAVQAKPPGESGAADGVCKVITSSTESTATANPAPVRLSPEGEESPQQQQQPPPKLLQPLLLSHAHMSRRPQPLSSFNRHLQLHKELVKLRTSRRRQQLAAVAAELIQRHQQQQQQQQEQVAGDQHESDAAGAASKADGSVVVDLGVIGSKRQRQQQQPQQQQDQGVVKKQRQQQQQQQGALVLPHAGEIDNPEQPEQQQPEQQQPEQRPLHVEELHQQPAGPKCNRQSRQRQPSQMTQQQQQQQQRPTAVVTGAAALELFVNGLSPSSDAVGGGGWDGGDAQLATQAAALQNVSQRKQRQWDEWDADYDRGKLKKVRKNKQQADAEDDAAAAGSSGANMFQDAWDQQLPQKARKEAWRADSAGQQRDGTNRRGRGQGGGGRGRGGLSRGGRGGGGGRHGGRRGGFGGRGRGGSRGRSGGRSNGF